MPRRRSFTLVELLVVVSIIAVLAALLLPALSRARGYAKKAACVSNLRQLMIVTALYEDDFGYILPSVWGAGTAGPRGFMQGQHVMYDAGYFQTDEMTMPYSAWAKISPLHCPSGVSPVVNWDNSLWIQSTGTAEHPLTDRYWDSVEGGGQMAYWKNNYPGNVRWGYGINFNMHKYSPTWAPAAIQSAFPTWTHWREPIKNFKEAPDEKLYFIEHRVHSWVTSTYLRLDYATYRTFRVPHLNTANYAAYDGHVSSLQRRYFQMGLNGATNTQIEDALPFKF